MRRLVGLVLGLALATGGARAQEFSDLMRMGEDARAGEQLQLAVAYINGTGDYPRDAQKGCALARKAAAVLPVAQRLVGECFHYGLGGEQNDEKAIRAYERAYARGDKDSACPLAVLLIAKRRDPGRAAAMCPQL